jgi:hypothetical protein
MRDVHHLLIVPCLILASQTAARPQTISDELDAPFQVLADGSPIDVQRGGNAAPFFGDFDGDGLPDLLVGAQCEGRLRVYHNKGTAGQPLFKDYTYFRVGAQLGRVPSG